MEKELKSEFQDSLYQTKKFLKWIFFALFILYIASGIFSIKTNEIGVLQRFGAVVDKSVMPGIHFAFPWPIDKINAVPVRKVKRIFIDDFYEQGKNAELFYRFTGLNSNCITGDNNIVTINCVLQYTIARPSDYLFNFTIDKKTKENNIQVALRSLATNTIIHCLSRLSVDETLTFGKRKIETYIKHKLQIELDELHSGINITFVELKDLKPPSIVQHYFDDVINAKIDRKKMIAKAESYRNEKLPQANAKAVRKVNEAEAYKNKVIDQASGESERFLAQLKEYRKNPEVTRRRLFLDMINSIYPNLKRKIIVQGSHIKLRLMEAK